MSQRGHIDHVSHRRLMGWAWDPVRPDEPETLLVVVDDRVVARVLADRYRGDLQNGGIGSGRFSFDYWFQPPLSPAVSTLVSVRRERDGTHLVGSPKCLESPTRFDDTWAAAISRLLGAIEDRTERERALDFLAQQADALRQRDAADRSGAEARASRRRMQWSEASLPFNLPQDQTHVPERRALVIDHNVPAPGRDAGSNAVLSHMAALQRLGYAVTFVAPGAVAVGREYLEASGIDVCARPFVASVEEVLTRQAGLFDVVYLHRGPVAARYAALVRQHQPRARLLYSVADLHCLRVARQAAVEERPELLAESRNLQRIELMAAWYADAVITHSSVEASLLNKALPAGKVHVVAWEVPIRPTPVPFALRRGIGFVAHYGHQPNSDAARWLVEAVMPILARHDPPICCALAGSGMPANLRALASPVVEVVGPVKDLAEIFDRVRLCVAPLAYGAGIKGKVLDSLANGLPCVCTPTAAEGIDFPEALAGMIAATPEDFAARIVHLHEDEALNTRIAEAGLDHVRALTAPGQVDGVLRRAIGR